MIEFLRERESFFQKWRLSAYKEKKVRWVVEVQWGVKVNNQNPWTKIILIHISVSGPHAVIALSIYLISVLKIIRRQRLIGQNYTAR